MKTVLFALTLAPVASSAQETTISDTAHLEKKVLVLHEPKRFYTGNSLDFAILSTALLSAPDQSTKLTMPRFTIFVNWGINFHYDLNRFFGLFSGLDIKNIGYIDKYEELTVKRRVYSLGVPLGIKIGDLRHRNFFFAGGGVDMPFNYREKVFEKRGDKEKFNEWFSDRTPRLMPFVFIGNSWDPGITLKLQYYPGNFLNTDFVDNDGPAGVPVKPYSGTKANLILLSLGIDIHYAQYKIQEREYQEQKKARAEAAGK
ncbi:MAG: hypothetical protein EOP49_08810 [Sphingobacteriales bacterium]|nr:MAG: hypothetical protein EOP49_08810 [Sphingobacteriales bacterium]